MIKGWDEDEDETGKISRFAAKHGWTTLRMSRPLFVGGYSQDTWWALGQWKGEKIESNDNRRLVTDSLYIYHPEKA